MARRIGKIKCYACCREVEVGYNYSNSDASIGMEDHTLPDNESRRCDHAGLVLKDEGRWLDYSARFYKEEDIRYDAAEKS